MKRRAFTIIELLVALGIIGLLVSLVLVSFKGVRAAANRTQSLNALRNMMRGYITYSSDFRQDLLPGYVDPASIDPNGPIKLTAKLPTGHSLAPEDTAGYVWRLAPYMDDSWETFFIDYRSDALIQELGREYGDGTSGGKYGPGSADQSAGDLGIAAIPSFGLNSIFVGGDSYHGDAATVARNPFTPADPRDVIAATNLAQVRNPARLTVFGATKQAPTSDFLPQNPSQSIAQLDFGYVELRAPFLGWDVASNEPLNQQWLINNEGEIEWAGGGLGSANADGGWPFGRWGREKIPVGHLDGSAEVVQRAELATDYSRWSPFSNARIQTFE